MHLEPKNNETQRKTNEKITLTKAEKIHAFILFTCLMLLATGVNLFLDRFVSSTGTHKHKHRRILPNKTIKRYAEGYTNIPSIFWTESDQLQYDFEYLLKEGTPGDVDIDSLVLNVDNLVLISSGRYNFRRREKMRQKLHEATKLIGSADYRFLLGLAESSESDYVSEGRVLKNHGGLFC